MRVREATFSNGADHWSWVDVVADLDDLDDLRGLAHDLELDEFAVIDTVSDPDLPKLDDLGHQILLVLHGLAADVIETVEVDCFVQAQRLTTIRTTTSPALEHLWDELERRPALAGSGPSELAGLVADVLTRRLLSVVDAFDTRIDAMIAQALAADAALIADVTAVRGDLLEIRRIVHPQREAIDRMRSSSSELVSEIARRRFSDVFDVAGRAASGLDAARTALSETLDAYRGAEARVATDVSKVLTVYAAIMLPLSLIAGFFGMNFENLPMVEQEWGWIAVTAAMAAIAIVSLGVFVALGWIRRPSGRHAGETLGRGLAEAVRTPGQLVGAVYEISALPIRRVAARAPRSSGANRTRATDD